jgi:hypothetical protein
MRKTDKKLDNQLRLILTDVCEMALKDIKGFVWLTHLINYSRFPNSLKVVCVFDTNENLADFMSQPTKYNLELLIQKKLNEMDVNLKKIAEHIWYDTEENCMVEHNGKWSDRLG